MSLELEIKQLEEKLLHSDVRSNPELLDELLSDDFEEIGATGTINSRADVVDWLVNKESDTRWLLTDFSIRQLSDDLVLAKYIAQKLNTKNKASRRSSLWKRISLKNRATNKTSARWIMIFHQGSNISE